MIGKEGEIRYIDDWETLRTYKGPLGIVELKRGEHDPSYTSRLSLRKVTAFVQGFK